MTKRSGFPLTVQAFYRIARFCALACAAGLASGCGGGHGAAVPAGRTTTSAPSGDSAAAMNGLYPQSQSPASLDPGPMPQTQLQPASAMAALPQSAVPESIGALKWTQLSGAATSVAVAPDGSLWALSSSGSGVNKSIWHYVSGTWTNIPGSAANIAVATDGTLYAVNGTTGGTYAFNGTTWSSLGGGARWVTTGADKAVYVLSNANVVNGNSAIWKYASGKWTQLPGSASQLAGSFDPASYTVSGVGTVAPNGYFAVNSSGGTYYYSPGTGYVRFPGSASGVAPITGGVFRLDYPALSGGEALSYFDYGSTAWTAEPGTGVSAAAGSGSGGTGTQLYIVNAAHAIWTTPITSGPPPTPSPSPSPAISDWVTYGNNNARTGESADTTLTASNVSTLTLAWHHQNFDYNVQTQPVVAANVPNVPYDGKTHTIVYVGGGSGGVYAYDAFSGQLLWKTSLAPGNYMCPSDDVSPAATGSAFGVQGTFAIDRANGVVYVPDGVHRVHALALASGADLWSVNVAEAGSDAGSDSDLREFIHTGLTLVDGKIYGGTSSTCDITPWRGRVFEIDVASKSLQTQFYPVYNSAPPGQTPGPYSGGGIWGWGGASSDGTSLYIGVGNADTSSAPPSPYVQAPLEWSGFAESVVRLSSSLTLQDSNWPNLTSIPGPGDDIDLSGTPVLFQPPGCPALLALQGKQGYLLIYNRANLNAGPLVSYQLAETTDEAHFIGLPAYSSKTGLLYVALPQTLGSYKPGMAILQPANGCSTFNIIAHPEFGTDSFHYGAANPRGTATLVNGVAFMGTPEGILWARDATSGAALWDSQTSWSPNLAGDEIRYGPAVTGGWVYVVATDSGSIYALKVSGAATSSTAASRSRALSATLPLPAAQIRNRPPQRRRDLFGRTVQH